ncbi:protein kinase-like domain protein [Metarhizium robertsii]|uniref:Protein kinase-like domain protein n=2 Tax=Metarhizium robertsii TaxID=568076 RepID=A0A0A1UWU2_9HYPO|nr:protein kinase-like domain protein [Metarhizium robertsii]
MIEEEWRYFAPGGAITPGGPSTWFILDWDQRRIIAVTMDEEQDSEDAALTHLKKHIDTLGPEVYAIHVSPDGELVSVSTNPEDDRTMCVYYPPLEAIQRPDHVKTVLRSHLLELDRLTPNVDLVSYMPCTDATEPTRAAFKYYFLIQFLHRLWHEMNLWMRLPTHAHIVPFDRLVLDELHGRVVGFTSLYIPGDTIFENTARAFELKWLRQLTSVVDDLNLKYGIAHQDVAPRNLVVDPNTNAIMVFDFNYSARIGGSGYAEDHNDVKGVVFTLYEIITRDMHFRAVPHDEQNPADVQGLEEWVQHPDVQLDHSVSEYRSVLNDWVDKRQNGGQISHYTEASEYIDWPDFPEPPPTDLVSSDGKGNSSVITGVFLTTMRHRKLGENGIAVLSWERPAQAKLGNGDQVLANGQSVPNPECTGSGEPNT